MEIIATIAIISIIIIVIDIYLRITSLRRYTRFLLLSNELINKVLTKKKVITREELEETRKEALGQMHIRDYESLKKDLSKIGIDIEH